MYQHSPTVLGVNGKTLAKLSRGKPLSIIQWIADMYFQYLKNGDRTEEEPMYVMAMTNTVPLSNIYQRTEVKHM